MPVMHTIIALMPIMLTAVALLTLAFPASALPYNIDMTDPTNINTDDTVHTLPYPPPILPRHANSTMPHSHLPLNKDNFTWRFFNSTFIVWTVLLALFILANLVVWQYPKFSTKRKVQKRERDLEMAFGKMRPGLVVGVQEPRPAANVGKERE
ncbi:hypothetical protein EK21DRAFT_119034 [Setomelanomma holmii]|uniref:Transmembrane protein n=1 Tax=Setomelanomma holmii TaxID=210430 RepID=A0A9P4GXX5_9PLEO|nr:hypothetical protein EK21DRAFT_119034 [Setomelanomma holmii]